MTALFPVHPDDVDALMRIRRYLIGFRKTNGWSQPVLSQMINQTSGIAYDLESSLTWQWRLSRLQGWCEPFDLRLRARLTFANPSNLDQRIHEHPEVAPVFALSCDSGAWAKWQRIYLTSALTVARKQLVLTAAQVSGKLGVTAKAVRRWEADADDVMLPKVLHHARVLGGRIALGLEEQDGSRAGPD